MDGEYRRLLFQTLTHMAGGIKNAREMVKSEGVGGRATFH